MNEQQVSHLSAQWLDQTISEQDLAKLKAELLANRSSLECYVAMAEIHSLLEQVSAPTQDQTNVVPMERIVRRQKRRSIRVSMMAAAAVLVLGLISMKLFFVDPAVAPATLAFQTSPSSQFTLSHSSSDETPTGMVMEIGSRLQLSQGTVELQFASGVKSIIIAPADLTMHGDDQLYLNEGTAWFHVPEQAIGFRVKTKDLDIVDLGTEFGVLAKPGDHDELHVLKGKVKVTTTRVRKESATLIAGEARRIDPIGRLDTIPVNPDAFLSSLPKSLPYLHWSFDQEDGYQVTGTHPEVSEISTTSYAHPNFTQGKRGSALSLDGAGQHLETDWDGFAGDRPRTVSFWLKIPEAGDYRVNPGIVGWGDRSQGSGKWKITLDDNSTKLPRLRLSWGDIWATTKSTISPNEWHQITVTSHGTLNDQGRPEAELYINGIAQDFTYGAQGDRSLHKPDLQPMSYNSSSLLIGSDLFKDKSSRHTFHGEIDELTIFDGYMTADEVMQLFHP